MYQNDLESISSRKFVFDYVHLLYYKCHKRSPNCGESYISFLEWIKSKSVTITINRKDNKCLEHAATFALNDEEIRKICRE